MPDLRLTPDGEAQLQRLAVVLTHAFQLAADPPRVAILGGERDPVAALTGWVRAELRALDPEVAAALLPILITRLERRLRPAEETP